MKDIDFDELDKAVNSLMATTAPATPSEPGNDQKPENVVDITPEAPAAPASSPPQAAPAAAETASTPVPVAVVSRPAPTVPAARRGGRFMDLVHTSSDMTPSQPPSREGISITPRPSTVTPPSAEASPAPTTAPSDIQSTEPPTVMPDPIDMAAESISESPASVAPPEMPEPATPAAPAPTSESPFIADAKVEKRPLNPGGAPSDEPLESILDSPEPAVDAPDEPVESKQADEPPVTPQIPELNSDLVAIESNEKVDTGDLTQAIETTDAAKEVSAPAPALGGASIAQQYKSQPSSGDQSHAAIYDASQYPEPVTHPAKKKSGWLWIVWVVLLLGVGAGGAVVLYNLGII